MKRQVLAVALAAAAFAAFAGDFAAGFARKDITPPLGCYISGYYKARHAKSILDPLQVNCVAFSDGAKTALVMQIDTCCLSDYVADQMRDAIVKATGVDRDAIMLHASHTHDGGPLRTSAKQVADGSEEPLTKVYREMCMTRAADAAVEAIRDLRPASLSCARTEARRITFGRRYKMKNGKVYTNPGVKNPDIVGPDGNPPDESVQVLRIDREEGLPICIVNFQTHPDVVGGETITADWPGLTRTVFEAATLGGSLCMVLNGTQGDVNHVNVLPLPGEENGLVNDFDNVPRGYEHAIHMANVLAGAALSVWLKCVPLEAGRVRAGTTTVRVPSQRAKSPEELALAKKYWKLHKEGKDDQIPFKHMELTTEVARARRIVNLENGPDFFDLPLIAVAIGDSVAFGGFPGEPFNDIGKAIKKDSPFKLTILSCLTNGSRGYFPFSDAYVGGGYESATSPFGPTVADQLIEGQLGLLKSIKAK